MNTHFDLRKMDRMLIPGLLGLVFLAGLTQFNRVDPDIWQEMALFREAVGVGRVPQADVFAYTPTRYPVVHHEWGSGAIFYLVAMAAGSGGIMLLRYLLAGALAGACVHCARKRGADAATLAALLPVGIYLSWGGFSPVRAQMYTMLFIAVLLRLLDVDRAGRRWWIAPFLGLHLVWLNLHGAFVLGGGLVFLHAVEQGLRRRPIRHLVLTLVGMLALILANPYGFAYYPYLWRALTMHRKFISEWRPLWEYTPAAVAIYAFSLVVLGYAAARRGVRALPGLPVVVVFTLAAVTAQRHVVPYAIVWTCYVPGYVQATPLASLAGRLLKTPRRLIAKGALAAGCVALLALNLHRQPWRLHVPSDHEEAQVVYPVGAVGYLRTVGFRGNLMTRFVHGAYVSWRLHPAVKVSLDTRYDIAYQPGVFEAMQQFYTADSGWEEVLTAYPTDAVLVPTSSQVAPKMARLAGWHMVYQDDAFQVHLRDGLTLPALDGRGRQWLDRFP